MALRPGADSIATPLLAEEYDERYPVLSPDGQFMAYVSNETGTSEVFVRPFPDVDSGRWQVSSDEGFMPVWANNGRELFFVDGSPNLVAARIEAEPEFRVLSTEPLLELSPEYQTSLNNRVLAVSPDDQRFLMGRLLSSEVDPGAATVLVQNFFEVLKARVPN